MRVLALLVVCAAASSCDGVNKAHAGCVEAVETCRPALAGDTLNGPRLDDASLRGKTVLVNFWATWCKPCVKEIPALEAAHDRHGPAGDGTLVVVGVVTDDPADDAQVQQFLADHGITYPILRETPGLRAHFALGSGLPTSFLFDRDGRLVTRHVGDLTAPQLEALLSPHP